MSVRDPKRRPSVRILLVPHRNPGTVIRQKLHSGGSILIGGSVHRGLAVVIHRVHIGAQIQRHPQRLHHFAFRSGIFTRRTGPQSRRHNQRRCVIRVRNLGVRAQRSQSPHQLGVRAAGRKQERRSAHCIQTGEPHIDLLCHPRVDVRSVFHQLLHKLKAAHVSGPLRSRIVVAKTSLANPRNRVQSGPTWQRGIRIGARIQHD